jgi:hypothetical protein
MSSAQRRAAQIVLLLVAAAQAEIGVWGTVAPRSFFDSYPGFGRHWVAMLGPYDEHLLRDFAGAELGFAVLLAAAAAWFTRPLVLAACTAFIAATLPHFIYHLTTTSHMSTSDNVASLGGFIVEIAAVTAVMFGVARITAPRPKETVQWPDSNAASHTASTSSAA